MRKLMLLVLLLLLCLPVAVAEEPLTYVNEDYGLSFELLEGWEDASADGATVFNGPADSFAMLAIGSTGIQVNDEFIASFDAATVETWMRESLVTEDFKITELSQYLFESTVIEDGRLYAYNLCAIAGEGFPEDFRMLHLQYFFTDVNGILGSVTLVIPAADASQPILDWFDIIVIENIPMEAWDALFAKIES